MLTIPAIDVYENKVARLTRGDFNQVTFYQETVPDLAKKYEKFGFQWLHLVDLMASKTGSINILPAIKEIKANTNLKLEFGGGIRSYDQVSELVKIGVDKIIIGSISITNKGEFEKILTNTGDPDRFVVAIDSNYESIFTKGWTENSGISVYDHIDYCTSLGITTFLCTDISKDGTLSGPSLGLYQNIMKKYPELKLIASGGVGSLHDVVKLTEMDLYAVVIGKAIYEKKIRLEDLINFGK
jgi:phosphoribosylformimino-5-aminoimidazole carboxamide ribotide isomerase